MICNQWVFSDVMDNLRNITCEKTGKSMPMISETHHAIIMKHANKLNSAIVYDRDFSYNYFGFKVCIGMCRGNNTIEIGIGFRVMSWNV